MNICLIGTDTIAFAGDVDFSSLKKFGFHYCFFFGRMLYLFSLLMLYIISRQNGIIAQLVRAPR